MRAAVITSQRSEFNAFLYAPVCLEHDGMTLSMLSAIARQDLDPWGEAARLSKLPPEVAVNQIRELIDALPLRTSAQLDCAEVAGRLGALLPRQAAFGVNAITRPTSKGAQSPTAVAGFNWRFLCVYFCAMLLMNWLMSQLRAPAAGVAAVSAAAAAEKPADYSVDSNRRDDAAERAQLNSLVRHGSTPQPALPPASVKSARD